MTQLTKEQSSLWINTLQVIKDEESRFIMSSWFTQNYEGCGTAACFCGHARLLMDNKREDFFSGLYRSDWPNVIDVVTALGGFFGSSELFFTTDWCAEAHDLYCKNKKYDGVITQVRHLFNKYDVRLHPDFCEPFNQSKAWTVNLNSFWKNLKTRLASK